MQALNPALAYVPAAHEAHDALVVMPVPVEKVPAAQARQEALAVMQVPVWKVPATHAWHAPGAVMPVPVEYVPAAQAWGMTVVKESPLKLYMADTSDADNCLLYRRA